MADEYGYRFTFEEIEGSAPPLPFNTPQDGDPPPPYEQFLSHAPQYAPSSSVVPDDFRAAPSIPANVPPPSYGVATFRRIPQAPFKLEVNLQRRARCPSGYLNPGRRGKGRMLTKTM
jgi:hypothetical protein